MRAEDEQEYVEYVSARLPVLHRAAYLMCGDGHRADDIVQATITSLYRHWRRARAADSIDAYVHRMLMRKHLDEKRRGWARVRLVADPPERHAPTVASVEEREDLRVLLGQLPPAQRAVLVLRFVCDMSVQEVAAVLRCSPGNVKSHTARGLATLRRLLPAQEPTPYKTTLPKPAATNSSAALD
jgi:RNA polymerase sigma-70 factor (sigma-E family)